MYESHLKPVSNDFPIIVTYCCLLFFSFFIISCGNYDEGYKDGYKGSEKEKWILFGRTEYEDGYLNGEFDAWCNMLEGTRYDEYEARCLKKFALKPKIEPQNEKQQ